MRPMEHMGTIYREMKRKKTATERPIVLPASPVGSLITLCTPKTKTRQTPRKASVTDTRAKDWVV